MRGRSKIAVSSLVLGISSVILLVVAFILFGADPLASIAILGLVTPLFGIVALVTGIAAIFHIKRKKVKGTSEVIIGIGLVLQQHLGCDRLVWRM